MNDRSNEGVLQWYVSRNQCTLMYPSKQGPDEKHMYGWSEAKAMYQSQNNERNFLVVSILNYVLAVVLKWYSA